MHMKKTSGDHIRKTSGVSGYFALFLGFFSFILTEVYGKLREKYGDTPVICIWIAIMVAIVVVQIYSQALKKFSPLARHPNINRAIVLIILSIATLFLEKVAKDVERDPVSIFSNFCFAYVAVVLNRLLNLGFECGFYSYFLGCFVVELRRLGWVYLIVAFIVCPFFFHIHG